jgi:hypothetical protein
MDEFTELRTKFEFDHVHHVEVGDVKYFERVVLGRHCRESVLVC